jgi:tetratricopeptide (TPR) repeat protein
MLRALTVLFCAVVVAAPAAAQRIRLPAGLSELETRAHRDSNDAAAQFNVALGYWNDKRFDDADSALRRAARIDPQFAAAYLALGRLVYARRPRLWDEIPQQRVPEEWRAPLKEGFRQYRRAFIVDPLVDLRIEAAARPGKSIYWEEDSLLAFIYDRLFQGFDDVESGNYEAAYNHFARLYDETRPVSRREALPDFVFYYWGLAAAHIGRYPEAIEHFDRLLRRSLANQHPDSLVFYIPIETNEYRYILAVLKQRAGRVNEAAALYREALENDAGLYMAHARLATIYESANAWEQAITERRAAVNVAPDDPSLLVDLGRTLVGARRAADAEEVFRQAMDANPHDARVPYYLGVIEQQLNKPEAARAAFTRFLAIAPSRYDRQIADAKQRLDTLH